MPMREQSRIKADTVAEECTCEECTAPAPKTCGSPVSGGRNCGDTTVATGSPITIVCGRCRTGRPPVDGARCRACGHYETSIEHATEKYAHCPSCGRAPHWMPVTNDDPANDSSHSEWSVHPTGTVADILASEPIPAPAPEPSAPPTGVPVCATRVHVFTGKGCHCGARVCDCNGCNAMLPLNPPPSDPVKLGEHVVVLKVDATTPTSPERCYMPTENPDGTMTTKFPAGQAFTKPSDPVTVATGGVPSGYRLGAGWVVDRTYLCSCAGCRPNTRTEYYKPRSCGKGACAAHAVLMGALVPVDTARSVPPGPVPVEACAAFVASDGSGPMGHYWSPCRSCGKRYHEHAAFAPPAAPASEPRPGGGIRATVPASEPAVRPKAPRNSTGNTISPMSVQLAAYAKYEASENDKEELMAFATAFAALEADLAEAKRTIEAAHVANAEFHAETVAARAEVEQLRGKLAEAERQVIESLREGNRRAHEADNKVTARVRSMREAAESACRAHHPRWCGGESCAACAAVVAIRALPLDTGTATDGPTKPETGGAR